MKIVVQHDDGTEEDITTGVQIAYDCVVHSMDWGSGFLDTEETDAIVNLARAARFPDFDRIFNEVQKERTRQEDATRRTQREKEILDDLLSTALSPGDYEAYQRWVVRSEKPQNLDEIIEANRINSWDMLRSINYLRDQARHAAAAEIPYR